jgi:hypothetical protein
MNYKEMWNSKYEELALEKFGCEYWECTREQEDVLARLTDGATRDYMADLADSLKDEAKYREIK